MSLKTILKQTKIVLKYTVRHPVLFFRALEIPKNFLRFAKYLFPTPRGRRITATIFLILFAVFGTWKYLTRPLPNINSDLARANGTGEKVLADFQTTPSLALAKTKDGYQIADDLGGDGVKIQNNSADGLQIQDNSPDQNQPPKQELNINFPNDYAKPIEVKLDDQRSILITDNSKDKFSNEILTNQIEQSSGTDKKIKGEQSAETKFTPDPEFLKYSSGRKSIYYSYQKDQALGERKLKNWLIYQSGTGTEQESYTFQNARLELDGQGQVKVFFDNGQQEKNQQAAADVDPNLMERARQAIMKDTGSDITQQNQQPDFTIPQAYILDKDGNKKILDWKIDGTNTLKLDFTVDQNQYPLALDPTLQFSALGMSTGVDVITGEKANDDFGTPWLLTGDMNSDGRTDLIVAADNYYNTKQGKIYIFYNDGSYPGSAGSADVMINGIGSDYFGEGVSVGDLNGDGKTDLAVESLYNAYQGRVFIFYNKGNGIVATSQSNADAIITGEAVGDCFGQNMSIADMNGDGKPDLIASGDSYNSVQGRVYIFYSGNYPASAANADVKITGEAANDGFGWSPVAGDFNGDGKTDLAVDAYGCNSNTGRIYIFYNNGSFPSSASSADAKIDGQNTNDTFGYFMTTGDLNGDGKTDIVASTFSYNNNQGRVYVFYSDGSYPAAAASADAIITGEAVTNKFGRAIATGDLNGDGKTDLIVGAMWYNGNSLGRVYVFLNKGSYPSAAASADTIISGEVTLSNFGVAIAIGDLNSDGKQDIAVGANSYNNNYQGRVYIFTSTNGLVNTNQSMTGENNGDNFGYSLVTGDLNADGKTDLAVGAYTYGSSKGRVYIFYSGKYPASAASADKIITGENTSDTFGRYIAIGDLNADGKTDLAVGAMGYSSNTGRVYIFYNGNYPASAASADKTITGENTSDLLSAYLSVGDLNADGKSDLVVGAYGNSSFKGSVYIFYNGNYPVSAVSADVKITGENNSDRFGASVVTGDLNADGKTDLAVVSNGYPSGSSKGRVYIFYNGNYPASAASASAIISGESNFDIFGQSIAVGDLNADGKTDLAVGASYFSSSAKKGRVYIFYNGSYPASAASASVIITGENNNDLFGQSLATGDLNGDGKTDLVVGANGYSSSRGRAYIFYNKGSYPGTAVSADTIITGDSSNDNFGYSLATGDLNGDGKSDLAIGAYGYNSSQGKVYFYNGQSKYSTTLQRTPDATRVQGAAGEEMKITGETGSAGQFGFSIATGDFNSDGKTDLAVGARSYNANQGKIYIFYNDGSIPVSAGSPDAVILGESSSSFGYSLASGDLNSDGKTDLVVGAYDYSSSAGRAYIFLNKGSYPASAANADTIITGEASSYFGASLAVGDLNADGRIDLAVGASAYSSNQGRVYIFLNDGSIPTAAASADTIITGEASNNYFGKSLATGDLNGDGKTDLAVGAYGYNSSQGRVYIFLNDGSIPTAAGSADTIITGEGTGNNFGRSLVTGDLNADGKIDLAVGAFGYNSGQGRAYILLNDGSIPTAAGSADTIITGEGTGNSFGVSLATGDFNGDGKTDLAAGASDNSSSQGRAYVFLNDGSIPTTAGSADTILSGENASNYYGYSLAAGDLNGDGKTDLIVGAYGFKSNQGRVYIYTFNDSKTTGEAGSGLGTSMAAGDFNSDGKIDLAVGAYTYNGGQGRTYIFYNNDGRIPTSAANGDVTITGEAANNFFGMQVAAADLDADGDTDLAVTAGQYNSYQGRAYIFLNDGAYPAGAASADNIITGESGFFGWSMTSGDLNADGKTDLVVSASEYSTHTGRVYIFLNDGSYPAGAASAEVKITGETTNNWFGDCVATGDLNADGKTDLVATASRYNTYQGRAYIFLNDGSYPAGAGSAETIITGENQNDYFGWGLTTGDLNADGRTDLAVGAYQYSSNRGRVYVFLNDGSIPTAAGSADSMITGENTNNFFGYGLTTGDLNFDGKTDLVVGAYGYNTNQGRVYEFMNDGTFATAAGSADAMITGSANEYLGDFLLTADFNMDSKKDLAISATSESSGAGKFYVIISEAAPATQSQLQQMQTKAKERGTVKFRGNVQVR